jgi:RNA polymerase sigma-70 factor (ECF subfamily)
MELDAERRLIEACLKGDQRAWDVFFEQNYEPTARFVWQLSSAFTAEDVEEICQEVFLRAIRTLHTFRGGSRLRTWVLRIAANYSKDYLARRAAAKRGSGQAPISLDQISAEGLELQVAGRAPNPAAHLMSLEDFDLVRHGLDSLEEPCREVIQLKYFADLSYDEISQALGVNAKTVSSRLSRCLDALERILSAAFQRENSNSSPV